MRIIRNTTFVVVPDSGLCSNDSLSAVPANRTAELNFRFPNVHLDIVSECSNHRVLKQTSPSKFIGGNPFPCSILKLRQGNVKLSGITFDNEQCARWLNVRGRVERTALLIRASRYFEHAEFTNVEFTTARFDEDDRAVGVHIAPIYGERYLYLDDVVFSNVKHGAVKCDRCARNVTASNVPLLEVYQTGGIFNATGTNFTLFDVNSVLTDSILGNRVEPSETGLNLSPSQESVTKYVLISLLAILILSVSVELIQNLSGRCSGRVVETTDAQHDHAEGSVYKDHFVLKPLLSSSPASIN